MDYNSNYIDTPININYGKSDKSFNFFLLIVIITIFVIIIIPWNTFQENMSAGTVTQLYANDSQDVYLKSNVDKLATGNFDLYWNQPTMVANTYLNRGTPLPSIILPDTQMNPNLPAQSYNSDQQGYNKDLGCRLSSACSTNPTISGNPNNWGNSDCSTCSKNNVAANFTNKTLEKDGIQVKSNNYVDYIRGKNTNLGCLADPASCGNGSGGYRLGGDWNNSVTDDQAKPFVGLQGNVIYPDSYVGSYWTEPGFDIAKPYPIIPNPIIPINPLTGVSSSLRQSPVKSQPNGPSGPHKNFV